MSKKNKLMIGLSSTAIPLLAAVSAKCGGTVNYEDLGKDAKKISLGVSFSSGQPQWNTMASLIKYYNEAHKNDKHFLPVELKHLGSGYPEGENTVITELKAKRNEVVNLAFNYGSLASRLASSEMRDLYKMDKVLNFEDNDKDISVDLKNINEKFARANSNTENLPNNGTFMIPMLKSIQVMSANAPVLQYIFKTFENKGAKFDDSFKKSARYQDIMTNGKGDESEVQKLWGEFESSQQDAVKKLTISSSTFENLEELLNFANIAQKSFKNSAAKNSRLHILGVDDVSGLIQSLPYAMINADANDFFIQTGLVKNKTTVNYKKIKDKNNKSVKALSEIYNKFKESLATKSLTLLAGGEYTSSYQTKHEYAFGIGSTAGYRHNFISDKTKKVIFTLKGTDVSGEKDKEFKNVIKKTEKGVDQLFVTFKENANKVYKSTVDTDKLDDEEKDSLRYSYKSLDSATDSKMDEILKKITNTDPEASDNKQWLLFLREDNQSDIKTVKEKGAQEVGTVIETKISGASKYKIFFLNDESLLVRKELSSKGTLQEKELIVFAVPGKWNKSNEKRVIYSQGPSLIGVSRGAKPDRAAKNFAKFLTSLEKIDITLSKYDKDMKKTKDSRDKPYKQVTPAQFISDAASYVFPVKGFEKTDTSKIKNKYIVHTYNELKEAVTNKNVVIYEEPAGFHSSSFRESLSSAFKSAYLKAKNDQPLEDFDKEIIGSIIASSSQILK
ncbi:P68 family surface lipoprotein [Mycoplasmopsis bovis]|uniref:P68 family surface lipoprotein n=1 Tax=Mycoplasmopsis bovis TaxID=28903 RepID=UPI003F7A429F